MKRYSAHRREWLTRWEKGLIQRDILSTPTHIIILRHPTPTQFFPSQFFSPHAAATGSAIRPAKLLPFILIHLLILLFYPINEYRITARAKEWDPGSKVEMPSKFTLIMRFLIIYDVPLDLTRE